jgi:high affinity Mn2+ porin
VIGLLLLFAPLLLGQDQDKPALFDRSDNSRVWISGQINVIHQQHPAFFAKYTGENSLQPAREKATSRVLTLYTGLQVTKSTEILFDLESAGGRGISDAFGLAGFTNLDVVRNPTLGSKPYLARLLLHQTIALGGDTVTAERNFLSLSPVKPERRVEIYLGKLGIADFFDTNGVGSDSHFQFMNWTVDNNGGYDYAADTRGYTFGAVADYESPKWGVRFAEALMPTVANGINLDWNLRRARAENLELQVQPSLWPMHQTALRFLSYLNHANMGSYREAIDAFTEGHAPQPDIEAHRQQGRKKYGFGLNGEQSLPHDIRLYGRLGWNEGRHESFAYTEVNSSIAIGGDLQGRLWQRPNDKVGIAGVSNGISGDHRRYLELGGKGFLLGDGRLTYGREDIVETYYTARLIRGIFLSLDLQHITHPGYNRDRGPVFVPGARLHLEF